jgi:glycosyltransferase involved in cell wall biosynthesis
MDCSIIIPACNEYPQVIFTIQNVIEELIGWCKFEVILVDNLSTDKTAKYFEGMKTWFVRKGVFKYVRYDDKLSHWNAKNVGVKVSSGKYLLFLDAHCIVKRDSIRKMIEFLRSKEGIEKVGGVHGYICYILDSHRLEYRVQTKFFGYQFCSACPPPDSNGRPYKVCVMSTCGMMSPRYAFDELGGWNTEFGIYAGGESYINWKQSTCGYPHWIHPESVIWHFADKRGYSWNHNDYVRNSFIAAYCVGGDEYLNQQVEARKSKDNLKILQNMADDVRQKCKEDRDFIASKQVMTLREYIESWQKSAVSA